MTLCKFCKADLKGYKALQIHCDIEHHAEYVAVRRWIGRTVKPKLKYLKRVAREGMIGAREIHELDD